MPRGNSAWKRHLVVAALAMAPQAVDAQQAQREPELRASVAEGFTIAVVGDIIIDHSLAHMMADPDFAAVVRLIQSADVATGNLEGNIVDGRSLRTSAPGGFGGEPSAAYWLKEMGFDLLQRPNNHANDFGAEGLAETSIHLDRAGLVHAGYGESYAAARAARFYPSDRGRVGMVATFAREGYDLTTAQPGSGEWLGRGGISVLSVNRYFMVPEDRWASVRTLRDAFPNASGFYARGALTETDIGALGHNFRKAPATETEPYYSFTMNERDLRDLVAAVREGKMRSDFMTFAIHSHHFRDAQGGYRGQDIPEAEHLDTNPSIPDFHVQLARTLIDNGADLYQGTGVHALRGIEIYRDRPIFYGLGEFIRQMDVIGISGRGEPSRSDCAGCPFPVKYETVIAISRFDGDRLVEIRLHPIELRYDSARMAHRGVPRIAPPETARHILTRLQELSAPLGTNIAIENDVGIIRP
jgi:poly-gamma-glutamate capsule biosynthesis protein CapA/YwtB (metallophosphatase superfamily)